MEALQRGAGGDVPGARALCRRALGFLTPAVLPPCKGLGEFLPPLGLNTAFEALAIRETAWGGNLTQLF